MSGGIAHEPAPVGTDDIIGSPEHGSRGAARASERKSTVRGTITEAALRTLLERDGESVVAVRAGKISRSHYAALLGCTPSALSRFTNVFEEYEDLLGVATGPGRHLVGMRCWLDQQYDAGELTLWNGQVDRKPFERHFGLRGGSYMSRNPSIRSLIEEFDAKVELNGYLPKDQRAQLKKFQLILADHPTLNKDRTTVNQPELCKRAGVPPIRLRDRPFADSLAECEAKIMIAAQNSRIDPYVYKRVFAFSDLAEIWPSPFLERVGTRFKEVAGGFAQQAIKAPYLQLSSALKWIGSSNDPYCRAVVEEARERSRITLVAEWEDALFAYRDALISKIGVGEATHGSVDGAISALRMMLDPLVSGRVVPETSIPLPGVKHSRRLGGHLKSVAEAGVSADGQNAFDYVAFIRDRFGDACGSFGTDMCKGESEDFVQGLAAEVDRSGDVSSDPVEAIIQVLDRRLEALRNGASAVVDEAMQAYERGRELLSIAQIDGAEFKRLYLGDTLNKYQRTHLVRRHFPHPRDSSPQEVEQGTANFLSFIDQMHGGVPPLGGASEKGPYGQFFAKRYLAYGGLKIIGPRLNPEPEAVGAALTLYLIDSGANISVGRTLDRECLEKSDLTNHRRITGNKARAKGKPIIVDLPDDALSVQALAWLVSAGGRLEARAEEDSDRLLIMRVGRRVQLMTPHWYTAWFKTFSAGIASLAGIPLTPSMIRPSVLLRAALGNDGRLAVGMALGQHTIGVTQGYQQKWPSRVLYDQNIGRFLAAFETLVLAGVEDAAAKLGITVAEFEARLGTLRSTGLGTFCRNPRGRPGQEGSDCSTLDCWNDCPHLLIVAEVEAIAALQLWQGSLRIARADWERDRPERWEEVWLPWLCLADVVEERMTRGATVKIWSAAKKRAAAIVAEPGYIPPLPR